MSETLEATVWTLPANQSGVTESRFHLSSDSIDNASPWTGERARSVPFLKVWLADLTFPPAPDADAATALRASWRERQGFITRLQGTSGLLRCYDSFRRRPAYDLTHDPSLSNWSDVSTWDDGSQWSFGPLPPFLIVDEAASFEAKSIVLRGLPVSTENVLAPADLMEGRPNGVPTPYGNLYEIVHTGRSNADGKARIYFEPGLRQGYAAGDPFYIRDATCVFRLADKGQGVVTRSLGGIGRSGMSLIEHIRDA